MKNMDVGDSDSSANSSNVDIVTAGQNIAPFSSQPM